MTNDGAACGVMTLRFVEGLDSRGPGGETRGMTTEALKKMSPAEKSEAARAKLRAMGIEPKPKDAWRRSAGHMKDAVYFDEAVRLGAEWRAAVNRGEIEEGATCPNVDP